MLSALIAFFKALPELLKLIENIKRNIEQNAVERKASDDIKKINEAFEKKDPNLLHDVFNG